MAITTMMHHQSLASLMFFCFFFSLGSCQVFYFGPCPRETSQRDFNSNEFIGRWYESNRTTPYYQNPLRCVIADFNRTLFGGTLQVTHSGQNLFGNWMNTEDLVAANPTSPAEFEVRVNNINFGGNYKIMSTDYRTYAIVWSCNDFLGLFHTELLTILTRAPRVDFTALQNVMNYLNQLHVNRNGLVATNQDFCNYRPLPRMQ